MLAFNYGAAVFVIATVTFLIMALVWGKGILDSFPYAFLMGAGLGFVTVILTVLFMKKKHTKVYELKDEQENI